MSPSIATDACISISRCCDLCLNCQWIFLLWICIDIFPIAQFSFAKEIDYLSLLVWCNLFMVLDGIDVLYMGPFKYEILSCTLLAVSTRHFGKCM